LIVGLVFLAAYNALDAIDEKAHVGTARDSLGAVSWFCCLLGPLHIFSYWTFLASQSPGVVKDVCSGSVCAIALRHTCGTSIWNVTRWLESNAPFSRDTIVRTALLRWALQVVTWCDCAYGALVLSVAQVQESVMKKVTQLSSTLEHIATNSNVQGYFSGTDSPAIQDDIDQLLRCGALHISWPNLRAVDLITSNGRPNMINSSNVNVTRLCTACEQRCSAARMPQAPSDA
jgi:hypothetical protein